MAARSSSSDVRFWRVQRRAADPVAVYLGTLSPASRRTIRQSLDRIARLVSSGRDDQIDASTFRWEKLTQRHTREVARRLDDALAPRTVNKMLSALRGVLRSCRQLELIREHQFQAVAGFEMVKPDAPTESRTLSADEVRRLLRQVSGDDAASLRDAVVLAVYLCCGPRRSELVALNRDDYDSATGQITIRGSRPERHRTIRLDPRARRALNRWLAVSIHAGSGKHRENIGGSATSMTSGGSGGALLRAVSKGGLIRKSRLTAQAVYDIIRKAADRAHLAGVRSRDLRRTAVVKMIAGGMSLEDVQHVVGQTSWLTPAAYRQLSNESKTS